MADPFNADIPLVNEKGLSSSYMEELMYQLSHVEEGSPTSSGAGEAGETRRDGTYFYICYATNSWGRIAFTTGY
jgi:hypothetical protein